MTAMIELSNVEKTFTMHLQGGIHLPVVRGVSFHVDAGECVVLSGPSGAGKSSILKMIYGNYRCDSGRIGIRHHGTVVDLVGAEPRQVLGVRRSTIGYVSQFLRAVPRVPTIDVVAEPLIVNGRAREEARERARASVEASSTQHHDPAAVAALRYSNLRLKVARRHTPHHRSGPQFDDAAQE